MVKLDNNNVPISSISRRLIIYVVLCSSLITLFLTGFQLIRGYQRDISRIDAGFEEIEKVHLKSFAASLWAVDTGKLTILVEGLSRLRDVSSLEDRPQGRQRPMVRCRVAGHCRPRRTG